MGEPAFHLDLERRYTYADYLTWPDDFRCELIDGKVYMMSPAPNLEHQDVAGEIFRQIANQLKGKPCRPLIAPLDVRLPKIARENNDEDTVLQPDVMVVCDTAKLDERGVKGAPDWVIEVLSPRTASKDHIQKRRSYEHAGVREYWLVHPKDRVLTRYILQGEQFSAPDILEMQGKTACVIMPDIEIDWAEMPPAVQGADEL